MLDTMLLDEISLENIFHSFQHQVGALFLIGHHAPRQDQLRELLPLIPAPGRWPFFLLGTMLLDEISIENFFHSFQHQVGGPSYVGHHATRRDQLRELLPLIPAPCSGPFFMLDTMLLDEISLENFFHSFQHQVVGPSLCWTPCFLTRSA
jgi:hypothetical protein